MKSFAVPLSALVLTFATAGVATAEPPAAPARACETGNLRVPGDINGDSVGDFAVGVPERWSATGGVDVRLSGGGLQRVSISDLGLGVSGPGITNGDRFGAALALADVNADLCSDVVVSAPGRNGKGAVYVAFGSRVGLSGAAIELPVAGAAAGDGVGTSLAVLAARGGEEPLASRTDVWASAPSRDVAGFADAGALVHWVITTDATGRLDVSGGEILTPGGGLLPGAPRASGHYGVPLVAGYDFLAVGDQQAMVDGKTGAGVVHIINADAETHALTTGPTVTQNSAGVPGAAETGDRFGAALAARGRQLAVGAPGEDLGRVRNAGLVQTFQTTGNPPTAFRPEWTITEETRGIPGVSEPDDGFGSSLAYAINAGVCIESHVVVVGTPGEDVGAARDAGTVTLVPSRDMNCAARVVRQGSGLPGAVEAGDRFGHAVGTIIGNPEDENRQLDAVLAGAPGENVGAVSDAGVVVTAPTEGWHSRSLTAVGGPAAAERYGSVFATAVQ